MKNFLFFSPTTIAELTNLLENHNNTAILSGGTDLLLKIKNNIINPEAVIGLNRLQSLRYITPQPDGGIAIGATATLTDIIENDHIKIYYSAIEEAARSVGSVQIQNIATLVGNVCNASPAADTIPPLMIYNARVVLSSKQGNRNVPLDQFITGAKKTVIQKNEFVEKILLPPPPSGSSSAYIKLGRTNGVDLAIASAACLITKSMEIFVSCGSVSPIPFKTTIAGQSFNSAVSLLKEQLLSLINPLSDIRASREYRLAMSAVLTERAVKQAYKNLKTREL